MTWLSGELARMACAISLSRMVLPARGGATMSARCPRPSGVMRSTARAMIDRVTGFSRMMRSVGKVAVRESNGLGIVHASGGNALDGMHFVEGEEFLPVPSGAKPPGDAVAGLESEPANNARRNVDILRPRAEVEARPTQESVRLGRHFQHAIHEHLHAALREEAQDIRDQLIAGPIRMDADTKGLHSLDQTCCGKGVQLVEMDWLRQLLGPGFAGYAGASRLRLAPRASPGLEEWSGRAGVPHRLEYWPACQEKR